MVAMAAAAALTLQLVVVVVVLAAPEALAGLASDTHPRYVGAEADNLQAARRRSRGGGVVAAAGGVQRQAHHGHHTRVQADLMAFAPGTTVGSVVRLKLSMEEGSDYNLSELRMECHVGSHVDAPGHMNQDHFAAGIDVDTLSLDVDNGA